MARGGKRRGSGRHTTAPHSPPIGQKWCPYGVHFTLLSDFAADKSSYDGLQSYCRSCQHQYFKARGGAKRKYHNLRRRVIRALGGQCSVCESTKRLDIDHLDPEQGYIHRQLKWNNPRIYRFALNHLEHFQLLCHEHHKEKHRRRIRY